MQTFTLKDAIDPNHPASKFFGLQRFGERREANQRLLAVVKETVDKRFKPHVIHASAEKNNLSIYVDSGAWALFLRTDAKRILRELSSIGEFAHLEHVQVRVSKNKSRRRK